MYPAANGRRRPSKSVCFMVAAAFSSTPAKVTASRSITRPTSQGITALTGLQEDVSRFGLVLQLCRMPSNKVLYIVNEQAYLFLSVFRIIAVGRIIAQSKPSSYIFLVQFRIDTFFCKFSI